MVLDMGEEDDVHLILRRLLLHTTSAIIYMKQGEMHFHFPREKVRCYFNSYTTYEKPKKNRNRRRRSQRLRQQAIKEEVADQKKEAIEEEAALEAKEEEKILDKEPQKQKTKKVWRKKEITPLSTPAQEEESLSPNSPDTQVQPEEEKSGEDFVPSNTPSSA
jgi:ABC-type multidrug transport system ATPase subunit